MHVLVTGGAGFIGSHTTELLLAAGHRVRIFDDYSTGHRILDPAPGLESIEGNVCDMTALVSAMRGCDAVLHLAAVVSVPVSIQRPLFAHEINGTGTLNVLEAARKLDIKRLVLASSAAVYGGQTTMPLAETSPLQSLSPYAAQKRLGELYAETYAHLHDKSPVCLRYFNVYGPRQDPASPYSGVLSRFIAACADGEPVTIHGDGSQTRDFVYVGDVARANLLALQAPPTLVPLVLNVGTGLATSVLEAYQAIAAALPERPLPAPSFGPARAGDVPHSRAAIAEATRLLGYQPRVAFTRGIALTLAWAKESRRA